jgi:hypothetical protein
MMRRVPFALMAAMVIVSAAACDEKLQDVAGPTPNLDATFSSIQRDIFNAPDATGRPACTSCHNAQFAALNGNLNLAGAGAYAALVNAPSSGKAGATRVVPGNPDGSYLIHKLEGAPDIVGVRMPNGGPYLSSGQIAIIRSWIQLGAANN